MNIRDVIFRGSKALGASFALRVLYYGVIFIFVSLALDRALLPIGEALSDRALAALILGLVFAFLHNYLFRGISRRS